MAGYQTKIEEPRRKMSQVEIENRKAIRRSVYVKNTAKAGQLLSEIDVEFRRPGFGLTPRDYEKYLSLSLDKDMSEGDLISLPDLNLSADK